MRSATGAAATALERARHPALPRLVRVLLLAAVADRSGGARATGLRHWLKYNIYGLGLPPIQHLSNSATTEEKLEAEMRLMNFVYSLCLLAKSLASAATPSPWSSMPLVAS